MSKHEPIAEMAERLSDAYSTERYRGGWAPAIRALRAAGLDDRQVEAVIRSKWARWAADEHGSYDNVPARALVEFVAKQSPQSLRDLTDESFSGAQQ